MVQNKDAYIKYVRINDEWHIADALVCKYIEKLEKDLFKEKADHAKYIKTTQAELSKQAERVAINLASGTHDAVESTLGWGKIPYSEKSCLAHRLDYYSEVKDGNPVYAYRQEVIKRIKLALMGKTYDGKDFR